MIVIGAGIWKEFSHENQTRYREMIKSIATRFAASCAVGHSQVRGYIARGMTMGLLTEILVISPLMRADRP